MQTRDPKKQMFLDMQEHPETYSDQELETMMNELDREPDVEAAWQRFAHSHRQSSKHPMHHWQKVAASVVGVIMLSGISFAAFHLWRSAAASSSKDEISEYTQVADTITDRPAPLSSEGLEEAPVVFDNVPLDSMLMDIAGYNRIPLEFEREESRQLRLHFVWKRSECLDRVVERLNNFEAVNIIREPEKLIVR